MTFMQTRYRTILLAAFMIAAAGSIKSITAQAEVSQAQREACTPDALRLCSSAIPDADRIKTCMIANKASLSARCLAAFPAASGRQIAHPTQPPKARVARADRSPDVAQRRVKVVRAERSVHHRRASGYAATSPFAGYMGLQGGRRAIVARQAMGMARHMLMTYRAGCRSQSIPADYCGF